MGFTPSTFFKKYPTSSAERSLGPYRDILPYRANAPMATVCLQVRQAVSIHVRAEINSWYVTMLKTIQCHLMGK